MDKQNNLLLAVDEQWYLQGYNAVSLLTHYSSSRKHLQNQVLYSGSRILTTGPTSNEVQCQHSLYDVCDASAPTEEPYIVVDGNEDGVVVGGVLGGAFFLLCLTVAVFWMFTRLRKQKNEVAASALPAQSSATISSTQVAPEEGAGIEMAKSEPESNRSMV